MRLLLIDDDEELCSELKEILEKEEFDVDLVFDGKQGLLCLQEREYSIIILDLRLPGVNGYGVLQQVRNSGRPVKVLILSGRPMGEPLLKEAGVTKDEEEKILNMADAVMNKPFMVDHFILKVKELSSLVDKGQ